MGTVRTDPDLLSDHKCRDSRKCFRSVRAMVMSLGHMHRLSVTSKYLSTADPTSAHRIIEVDRTRFEILEFGASGSSGS